MLFPSTLSLTAPRLLNRYSIHKTLGARLGRRTLLGYDHDRSRWVIIKYLCFDDPIQTMDIKRFHKEIAVLQTLDHPAIPSYCGHFEIYDHGYHGLMLVQEHVEGQSLYALVNDQRRFTEAELRNLARQILEILDYLHHQCPAVIHRDIKPSSFVLSEAVGSDLGRLYLVDFGLVQCCDSGHSSGDQPILISGTPGYRPPEQLGDQAMPVTDLYSLGATLIHLASGKHPNSLPQRGLHLVFSHELGEMSRPFKAWLRWLTQPRQYKRPASAQAAIQGLEQAHELLAPSRLSLASLGHRFHRALLEAMAPANTQLKILGYSQTVEVLLPPLGWKNLYFFSALLQVAIGAAGLWLVLHDIPHLWPQIQSSWQQLGIVLVSLGLLKVSLGGGYRGIKHLYSLLFQQISIQLLPDIMLLGYRLPCRPVEYRINTYRHNINDIDLQPGSSVIRLRLNQNRTRSGGLEHELSSRALGLSQSEILWLNDILQLWFKQTVTNGSP